MSSKIRTKCDSLAKSYPLLRWGTKFVCLEECSENYQKSFMNARKVSSSLTF